MGDFHTHLSTLILAPELTLVPSSFITKGFMETLIISMLCVYEFKLSTHTNDTLEDSPKDAKLVKCQSHKEEEEQEECVTTVHEGPFITALSPVD